MYWREGQKKDFREERQIFCLFGTECVCVCVCLKEIELHPHLDDAVHVGDEAVNADLKQHH